MKCILILLLKFYFIYTNSTFNLNLFNKSTNSKCLDGSNYGVYYSPGEENNIFINFWGGGWCSGRSNDSFISDCYERSQTSLGSSKYWFNETEIENGFLSGNSSTNPNFYNWHRFDFPYCDGTGHQGYITYPIKINNTELFFRGHMNTLTGLHYVISKLNMSKIEKVVISGCSAGGLATYYWSNYINDLFKSHNSKIQVFAIPDSGFFVDHLNIKTKDHDYLEKIKILYSFVNNEVEIANKDCVKDHIKEEYKCFFAEKLFKYINIPVLMIQPGYDSWQMVNILGEDCIKDDKFIECSEEMRFYSDEYKDYQSQLILDQVRNRASLSVWSPACLIHCFYNEQINNQDWVVPEDSGNTINSIISKFINSYDKIVLMDDFHWPSNKRCSGISALKILIE